MKALIILLFPIALFGQDVDNSVLSASEFHHMMSYQSVSTDELPGYVVTHLSMSNFRASHPNKVEIYPDSMVLIYRVPPSIAYATVHPSRPPDTLIRRIYKSVDGCIKMVNEQRGYVQERKEQWVWDVK